MNVESKSSGVWRLNFQKCAYVCIAPNSDVARSLRAVAASVGLLCAESTILQLYDWLNLANPQALGFTIAASIYPRTVEGHLWSPKSAAPSPTPMSNPRSRYALPARAAPLLPPMKSGAQTKSRCGTDAMNSLTYKFLAR